MTAFTKLEFEAITPVLKAYQTVHEATPELDRFDEELEKKVYERLVQNWKNGWDFCTATSHFGDRGVSILVQNRAIDWKELWDWLVKECSNIPTGAMINFEAWDNIEGKALGRGQMKVRRLILSQGIYEEILAE